MVLTSIYRIWTIGVMNLPHHRNGFRIDPPAWVWAAAGILLYLLLEWGVR